MRLINLVFAWHFRMGGMWLVFADMFNWINGFCIRKGAKHSAKMKLLTEEMKNG